MQSNYYSIDDILATQTRVPCKFELLVMNLGYLNSSSGLPHIQQGTKLELPFWLARGLCGKNRHIVSVQLPGVYKPSYREILSADASVVNLHKHGPYFYEFGLHLLEFPHHDTREIANIILQTFKLRFRHIMDISLNSGSNEDVSRTTSLWDELERSLFSIGRKCFIDFHNWQTCDSDKIKVSTMVMNHKKRKRNTLQAGDHQVL